MINLIIADDDEIFVQTLKKKLENTEFKITYSYSAEHSVSLVKDLKPDLIILDNHFPKLNGSEVIPTLKEYSPASKIIMTSSFFTLKEIESIILNQADYIILKSDLSKEKIFQLVEAFKISNKKEISFWTAIKNLTSKSKVETISNIAIIEDDEIFSYNLQWHLNNEFPTKLINTFNSPKTFLNYCSASKPDLIFLDHYLEGGDGLEIVHAINKMSWNPKIIVISAQEDTKIAQKLQHLGVMGYIVKDNEWLKHLKKYLTLLSI